MIKTNPFFRSSTILLIISLLFTFLFPYIPTAYFLLTGILLTSIFKLSDPRLDKIPRPMLNLSIVLMGFGLSFNQVMEMGIDSIPIALLSILSTMILGFCLTKLLNLDLVLGCLLTVGTAICGGSAIAAVSSSIHAKSQDITQSTLIVFLLNGIALLVFPQFGHLLHMNQHDFGLWAALAIHDTSSVVGAAEVYGDQALELATTVKLLRSLWIFPVSLLFGYLFHSKQHHRKVPVFIIGFIAAALLNQLLPSQSALWSTLSYIGKHLIKTSLVFIGMQTNLSKLMKTGLSPMIMSLSLWIFVSIFTATLILI